MAYTAWSVVFGEQPTAAKWNQLGANDAGFKDGTNIDNLAILTRHLAAGAVTEAKMNLTMTAFTNGGTGGGTGFYISLGGLKILMVKNVASNASAWKTVDWTTVGFTAIPYVAANAITQQGGGTAGGWVEFTSLSSPAGGSVEQNGCSLLTRVANATNTAVNVSLIVIGK